MKTAAAKKGSVTVMTVNGTLLIALPRTICNKKQVRLYFGLDTETNKRKAEILALQIEQDIESERFDITLIKYKQEIKRLKVPQKIESTSRIPHLGHLWDKYSEFRESSVTKGYFYSHYIRLIPNCINKLPSRSVFDAILIRDYLVKNYSAVMAKRYLTQFSACCDWAFKSKIINTNPFEGLGADIRVKNYNWRNISAFSETERDAIIGAYESNVTYCDYADFIRFLFLTGCRTGEAVALRWEHISRHCDEINFCETWCRQFGRKPTKTDEQRKFPANSQLQQLLLKLRGNGQRRDALVFPSPVDGREIKVSTFLRSWLGYKTHGRDVTGIVKKLVEDGLVQKYLPPYNTRHSFISWCLVAGIPVHVVASWVGNNPEVIHRHYAACVGNVAVPEFNRVY